MTPSPIDTTTNPDERLQRRLRALDESRYRIGVPSATGAAGPEGPPGAAGSQIRSGSGVPSNALGVNGDYYLRTTTEDLYVKSAGTYSILVNLKGSTGSAGANGSPGLVWKGAYASGTEYAENDAVTAKGSSWRSKKAANKGHEPPNAEWWELIAEGGSSTVVEELLASKGVGFVNAGTTVGTARPTGFKIVIWEVEGIEPTNATAEDIVVPKNSSSVFVPAANVYNSGAQSIPNAAITQLLFDSEFFDNAGIHSTSSNTGRLTAPKSGVYTVSAFVGWTTNATGDRYLAIRRNGEEAKKIAADRRGASNITGQESHVTAPLFLNAGEYVDIVVYQGSGGALTLNTLSAYSATAMASLVWLGSGLKTEAVDWGVVTALPAEPTEGDRCTFKVETGVYWELLYTGEATYPWTKIGGPPIHKTDIAVRESTSETKAEIAATKITLPLAMEADVTFGAALVANAEAALSAGRLATYKNATTELDWASQGGSQTFDGAAICKVNRHALAKSDAVATFYRVEVAGKKVKFTNSYLRIDPVRVG